MDIAEGTNVFVNENLCSCYRALWYECKKLLEEKVVSSAFAISGSIKLFLRQLDNWPQ